MKELSQNIYFVTPALTANGHPAMSFLLGSLLGRQDKFRCSPEMERFYFKSCLMAQCNSKDQVSAGPVCSLSKTSTDFSDKISFWC